MEKMVHWTASYQMKQVYFFEQQNTDSLIATLNSFETTGDTAWNVDTLKAHAQGFSEVLFRDRMETYLQKVVVESYS